EAELGGAHVIDRELDEVVDDRGPAARPAGQELGGVALGLLGLVDPDDRLLLRREIVEEGPTGDADLVAQLLDGEAVETALGGQTTGEGGEPRRCRRHALRASRSGCTLRHEVQYCTWSAEVQNHPSR